MNNPPKRKRQPQAVGNILEKCLQKFGLETKLKEFQLADRWKELVGPSIAVHSRPSHVTNQTLYVHVDSPLWLTHLQYVKFPLLERIKKECHLRQLSDIHFSVRSNLEENQPPSIQK